MCEVLNNSQIARLEWKNLCSRALDLIIYERILLFRWVNNESVNVADGVGDKIVMERGGK